MPPPLITDPSTLRLLDARQVHLTQDSFGRLQLEIGIEERYEPIRVLRSLPLTDPDAYISLQSEEGEEIGMLESSEGLDPHSLRLLREELEMVYLRAEITGIKKIVPSQGLMSWELETDLGPRTIFIRDRHDIRPFAGGRIVVTDVHGARYEIPSVEGLDDRSRSWLEIEL